eukprot:2922757-Alexandrium_andersonii.AAC.1
MCHCQQAARFQNVHCVTYQRSFSFVKNFSADAQGVNLILNRWPQRSAAQKAASLREYLA